MKKVASTIIFIFSLFLSILGIYFIKATTRTPREYENDKGLFFVLGIIFFGLGIFLWRLSKRIKSISATKILQTDKRAPVLYLRSFQDEKKSFRSQNSSIVQYITLTSSILPQNLNSEEEQLTIVLNNIGPTICLGKPGDLLPPSGMYRDYIPSEKWQQKVKEFISISQLILIRANETEGLRWEIDYVWNHVDRKRLIFLLPEKQKKVESFNQLLATIIGKPVPSYRVEWLTDNFSGLLYFDNKNNPKVVAIKKQAFRFGNLISLRLKKTLESLPEDIIHFEKLKLANKKERVYAFFLDCLVMFGIAAVPSFIWFYYEGYENAIIIFLLSTLSLYVVYSFLIEMSNEGMTFGKKHFKLKLMDKEQIEPTFQQIFARTIFKLISCLLFYINILVFLFTGNHLHDYLSATRIFKISHT